MTDQGISSMMVKDCKVNFLHYEYSRYSHLINNQTQHVEFLYKENVLNLNTRNNVLRQLSELIRFMNNDIYNVKINEFKKSASMTQNEEIIDMSENNEYSENEEEINGNKLEDMKTKSMTVLDKNICDMVGNSLKYTGGFNLLFDICKNNKLSEINEILFDDFDKVKVKLLDICKDIGFYSLDDALNLLIGNSYKEYLNVISKTEDCINKNESNIVEFIEKIQLYNSVFIPVDYRVIDSIEKIPFIKSEMEWQLNRTIPNSDIYVDTYGEVTINFPEQNKSYIIGGYFINDPIHCIVRTSQICRHFLYKKKKFFQSIVDKMVEEDKFINSKFANIYIKNMNLGDILSYDENSFKQKINTDYLKYISITKMKAFKNQMDEFNKDNNLKNMYNTIRLLLMGPDDCVNVAGLLFGLTKDKKYNAEFISELIYRKLSYPLQVQLKKSSINLKNELEKFKSMSENDVDIKRQIAVNMNIPPNIKKIIFDKMEEIKFGSGETSKQKEYIDILTKYPWTDTDYRFEKLKDDMPKCRDMLNNVYSVLQKRVYGHEECKNTIRELVCKLIMNPNTNGKALGLMGPPGVGKTLIAKGLGEALGIPCMSISLCGVEDPAVLNGHSFTYSAAKPGLIVRKMVEAGNARCIMFFDELDKSCQKHGVNEIQNVLINVTDPNMNSHFNDKFFDTGFPLNKVIFVFSYNDKSKIDPILMNRIQEIEVKPYTVKDKLKICQEFLLKEVLEEFNLKHKSFLISDKDVEYIVENYTNEPGVRELKRKLDTLFSKIVLDYIYGVGDFACPCTKSNDNINNINNNDNKNNDINNVDNNNVNNNNENENNEKIINDKNNGEIIRIPCKSDCKISQNNEISPEKPVLINHNVIVKYLKKIKHNIEKIHQKPDVGTINGLYATTIGNGGIISILIYRYHGGNDFVLKLTGSQGNVMKESVEYSYTVASRLIKDEYLSEFIKKNPHGLHIHTPDGATPKDGPSAGSAFTTAFISRILNKKIRNDIAMTGEIGRDGDVNTIGGLVYKLRGAKAAGVRHVFVPKGNENDFNEIIKSDDKLIDDNFKVTIVSHIKEILPLALLEDDDTIPFDVNKYLY